MVTQLLRSHQLLTTRLDKRRSKFSFQFPVMPILIDVYSVYAKHNHFAKGTSAHKYESNQPSVPMKTF